VRYTYDPTGRVETVTDPAGGVTRYTYDASHRILTITDPRNITFLVNEYEPMTGRVSRQTQADDGVFTFTYSVTGSTVTQTVVTNPRGHATTYRFNAAGFPLLQMDALGQPTVKEYVAGSNLLLSTTDPLGRVTRTVRAARREA
jgi:YD repeat-containing protein